MISIIIPTFNRCNYLFRAIESVLLQTYKNWELLIVDDGSTDQTYFHLKSLLKENQKIRYIRTPNRGVSAARNLGIKLSKGDLIAFLDSDDEWYPEKLDLQISFLEKNLDISLVHSDETWVRNGKRVNQKNIHKKEGGEIFCKCLNLCAISPSTVLIRKELFKKIGLFREDFPVCEDYELWLRVTAKLPVGFIDIPLIVKYGGHIGQLSQKFIGMDFWRIKAMSDLLKTHDLRDQNLKMLSEKLKVKTKILVEGAKKHKNLELLKKLDSMLN